ncbi:MAG: hypothetical protein K8R59_08460, partial [Thermoanaerobaculales bacterium]|nr:hypothetical protein [Thermoanaerobaculales bacterium]
KLGVHPLYRALRPDKMALVQMDQVLRAHQTDRLEEIPLYAMLETPNDDLKRRADRLGRRLRKVGVPAHRCATRATLGGGTTPDETLPSHGLELPGGQSLLDELRQGSPPVIGRIEDAQVLIDLRTVLPHQDRLLVAETEAAYNRATDGHKRQAGGK